MVWINFLYNAVNQLLTIAIPLITTPYLSRILGAGGIGRFSYAYSIANYFVLFSMLGLNNYGNRTIARVRDSRAKCSKTFWEIYLFQLSFAAPCCLLYFAYSWFFSDDKKIALIMFMYVLSGAIDINWFFYGIEEFKTTVKRNVLVKLCTTVLLFMLVKTAEDVYVYCIIYASGMLITQIILWFYLKQYVDFCPVETGDVFKHFKPNIILFIPVVAVSLYKVMDKIMLGLMANKVEVGYYESCDKIMLVPISMAVALGMAMLPRISNLVANKNEAQSRKYIQISISLVMVITCPLALGIIAVAPDFVPVFYGKGFDKCVQVFEVIMPSCFFLAFANVIRTQYLIPYEKDSVYIISVIIGAIVNLLLNSLFIPIYQSVGAAIGTLCAEFAVCFTQAIAVRKSLPIKQYVSGSIPFLVMGLMMLCIVRIVPLEAVSIRMRLFLKAAIGGFLYISLVLIYAFTIKKVDFRYVMDIVCNAVKHNKDVSQKNT